MKKHFVTFCSPGILVSEQTTKEIESWNITQAREMAESIKERHGATPYGFYFTTRSRDEDELDSKETARSGMYYLGGEVLTLDDVKARNDPNDWILISNMECNNWDRIIVNTNSWKFTAPFNENDVVLSP
jgi:hypothetical protein